MRRVRWLLSALLIAGVVVYILHGERSLDPIDRAGRTRSIGPVRGERTVIHFWATWCAPCRRELPDVVAFVKQHPNDFRFYAIATDRSPDTVWHYVDDNGIARDTLFDRKMNLSKKYKIHFLPTTIVFDGNGEIVARYEGMLDWNDPKIQETLLGRRV
jgi:cytochrome c biogenesis protein CcmG, thiol:disulfide interchange protein DsbE